MTVEGVGKNENKNLKKRIKNKIHPYPEINSSEKNHNPSIKITR